MFDKPIPEVEGELRVGAGETRNKVVFPGANRLFSRIGSMVMRGNKLVRNLVLFHERLESWGAFIVEELDFGGEAAGDEIVVKDCKYSCELLVVAAF